MKETPRQKADDPVTERMAREQILTVLGQATRKRRSRNHSGAET